ncbi:MAG: antitoxin Xre-like helix-turn-helix domain-containing protein [Trueperaceae bacterium]
MTEVSLNRYHVPASRPPTYGENIGLHEADADELIETLKRGLPVTAFDNLRDALDVTKLELAGVLGISERTLARRLKSSRFNSEESERIYRIARLLAKATVVLESDGEAAIWLKTPKRYLKGKIPLQYAGTEVGAQTVERLLGRIEHGVFS